MSSALPLRTDIAAPSGSLHPPARRLDDLDLCRRAATVFRDDGHRDGRDHPQTDIVGGRLCSAARLLDQQ
jgi:hypothetical protein